MKKRSKVRVTMLVLVLILSVIWVVPIYWMFVNSFQPNEVTMKIPPDVVPNEISIDNYKRVWNETPIFRWTANSFFLSLARVALTVYICSLAAFPLAKRKFPGSDVLFWIVIVFMTVPRDVLMLPLFFMIRDMHLYDTYGALLLPNIAWPVGLFLMKQTMQTIPNDIIDSAHIDGCGSFRMFNRILLPMVKPGIGALAIFAFTDMWGDYLWQLIVISSEMKKTLPVGIAGFRNEFIANYGLQLAGASIGAIPLVMLFLFFQRYFIKGLTVGAVKG